MADNNALCIIGQEKSKTNLKLLEEAKKRFNSVFFVPIDRIGIGLNDKFSISYRVSDILKFKAIFPRIPKRFCSYAYQLLSLFPEDTYMAIKPISFLLAAERFFLLTVLRKRGIETLNLHLTRSTKAAYGVIEESKYPLVIRTPEKKTGVVVKNLTEAKSVIDALGSLNQPIMIEDVVKDMISVYVAEPEVMAAVRKKTREKDMAFATGKMKKQSISMEIRQLALDAARAVEAGVARIDISINGKPKVVNVRLDPGLIAPSKATGVNMPKMVVDSVYGMYKEHKHKPTLVKFFEDAKSVVKDVLKTKQLL